MEPPSYEEASQLPPALGTEAYDTAPPPPYDASLNSPSTPPPTYGEAVTTQPDLFPVLTVPPAVTTQSDGSIVHPITQIGATPSSPTAVVVTQPQPVPISVTNLQDSPAVVRCPHCHHVVTSKVRYLPGRAAWCTCLLLTLMGLICGFCLIPFMIRGLQDAHHSCPRCEKQLHIYTRPH